MYIKRDLKNIKEAWRKTLLLRFKKLSTKFEITHLKNVHFTEERLAVLKIVHSDMKLKHDLSYLKGKTNKFSETGQLEATFLIDSKPITGLLDTGASRSLVSLSWLKENFSLEEINNFPRVNKPNVYDASGNNIKIVASLLVPIKHEKSWTRTVAVDIYLGTTNLFGSNIMSKLQCTIKFTATDFFLYFRNIPKEIYNCLSSDNILYIPPFHLTTIPVYCKELLYSGDIECEVFQGITEKKYLHPQLVKVSQGSFNVNIENPTKFRAKIYPFKIHVRPINQVGYDIKELNIKELGTLGDFLDHFEDKQSNLEMYKNVYNLNGQAMHLKTFYESERTNSERENDTTAHFTKDNPLTSVVVNKPDEKVLPPFTREVLEDIFKDFDNDEEQYSKEMSTKEFFVDTFLKYPVLARHQMDCGVSSETFDVPLKKAVPRTTAVYPLKHEEKSQLKNLLDYLLVYNIIKKCDANEQFGSPCFIIPKKSGLPRLIVDQRAYNSCIDGPQSIFMPGILDALREKVSTVHRCTMFDLKQAYYGMKLSPEALKTGISNFTTPFGVFKFLSTITGNSSSPCSFIEYVLKNLHTSADGSFSYLEDVLSHYDDINVLTDSTKSLQEHLDLVRLVIERVHKMGLKLSHEKSVFLKDLTKESVNMLGFEVSHNTLKIPKDKMLALQKLGKPKNLKEAQSFIGSLVFYRNLLGTDVLTCLNILSAHLHPFQWTEECNKAFMTIKKRLTQDLKINFPIKDEVILVMCDASNYGLGGNALALPLEYLGLYKDETLILETNVHNEKLAKHSNYHNMVLESPAFGTFQMLIKKINIIYNLKLGNTWEEIKSSLVNHCRINAPAALYKLEGGWISRKK